MGQLNTIRGFFSTSSLLEGKSLLGWFFLNLTRCSDTVVDMWVWVNLYCNWPGDWHLGLVNCTPRGKGLGKLEVGRTSQRKWRDFFFFFFGIEANPRRLYNSWKLAESLNVYEREVLLLNCTGLLLKICLESKKWIQAHLIVKPKCMLMTLRITDL